ncbi:MAG: hypothetical protein ACHQIM_01965 [Sphingobacteriales bacterium]
MELKTFWKIFLKIFSLYLIWQTLVILPSFFSTLIFVGGQDKITMFTTVSAIVFIALFFIFIIRYCLFQTDRVIDKLHLEKGFPDEKLEINIHRSSLLSIAIIILGGLMLADGLPLLVYHAFYYIQRSDAFIKFQDNRATPYLVSNFLKVLFGYFMVADNRLIVNFIERKRKKTATNIDNATE